MTPNAIISGIKVFVTESCETLVPRRKHKKRRIQKKWEKRYGTTFIPYRGIIVADLINEKVIFCHPKYWDKVKELLTTKGVIPNDR